MAARFSPTKRQDLLVLALPLLQQRRPEVSWRITLAGDGDCYEQIQALAHSLGVGEWVEFRGNLDETALISWFQSLDLYAHSSEVEALSTSMLQAMAMGLPMVASAVPGISNLLENGGTQLGVLTTGNTPEAFAAAIATLQSNPDLQSRLVTTARERVCNSYSQEKMFASYDNLIQGYGN
jgi:glycosyltransferase involved in cell wall biosynthesis